MNNINNYHQQSMIWENEYSDELLVFYSILLNNLNKINKLTEQNIDMTILSWEIEYNKQIEYLNKKYVCKLDLFTNKIVPRNDTILEQKEKVDELAKSNDNMLNITTEYIRQRFFELAILESSYNYSSIMANEILQQIIRNVEDKIALFATMSTIGNLRELITSNAESRGFVEYYWMTQRDDRVRSEHVLMDGKWFRLDDPEPKPLGMKPGIDYNCRCWMADFR